MTVNKVHRHTHKAYNQTMHLVLFGQSFFLAFRSTQLMSLETSSMLEHKCQHRQQKTIEALNVQRKKKNYKQPEFAMQRQAHA